MIAINQQASFAGQTPQEIEQIVAEQRMAKKLSKRQKRKAKREKEMAAAGGGLLFKEKMKALVRQNSKEAHY